MNTLRIIIIAIAILGLSEIAVAAEEKPCSEAASVFLKKPSKSTLSGMSSESEAACWANIGIPNASLNHLLGFVEKGNRWAAEYLSRNLRKLDGGNLEDSLISLGHFSELRMEVFLTFAKMGYLSEHEFTDALTMLPLSVSDDQKLQLSMLNARREKIIGIRSKGLDNQKSKAVEAVDGFISEIKSKPDPSSLEKHP